MRRRGREVARRRRGREIRRGNWREACLLVGFIIQDQEWCEGHKEVVLGQIKKEVMNAPLIGFDHCWQHPKHPPEPENTRKWSGKKRDGRIPLSKAWKFKGRDERPLYGSYHYWRYMIRA
ncbi:hypothetical protein YC2023_076410 [Brassica napus]